MGSSWNSCRAVTVAKVASTGSLLDDFKESVERLLLLRPAVVESGTELPSVGVFGKCLALIICREARIISGLGNIRSTCSLSVAVVGCLVFAHLHSYVVVAADIANAAGSVDVARQNVLSICNLI